MYYGGTNPIPIGNEITIHHSTLAPTSFKGFNLSAADLKSPSDVTGSPANLLTIIGAIGLVKEGVVKTQNARVTPRSLKSYHL